ncbi:MAG TPA: YebC/PmpR family DNA-binding transcriptional regulator [Longimicrobiales bacterium]
MAGHSKWAQIKRKKAVTDQRRGAVFTRMVREITIAARSGGGNPDFNPRLRLAVDTAKAANMPADNIDRAIKKGTGELEGVEYQEITYEGYGPAGVAILIDTVTDNANRTVAEIRHALSRHGGTLGTSGSVAWQFDHKGQIYVNAARYDEDTVMSAALDAGAEDMEREGDSYVVTTDIPSFHTVQSALKSAGIAVESASLEKLPKASVHVDGEDVTKLLKLLDALEELDDVQKVHSNLDIDESALAEAEA